jgi:hypothetical protein
VLLFPTEEIINLTEELGMPRSFVNVLLIVAKDGEVELGTSVKTIAVAVEVGGPGFGVAEGTAGCSVLTALTSVTPDCFGVLAGVFCFCCPDLFCRNLLVMAFISINRCNPHN